MVHKLWDRRFGGACLEVRELETQAFDDEVTLDAIQRYALRRAPGVLADEKAAPGGAGSWLLR